MSVCHAWGVVVCRAIACNSSVDQSLWDWWLWSPRPHAHYPPHQSPFQSSLPPPQKKELFFPKNAKQPLKVTKVSKMQQKKNKKNNKNNNAKKLSDKIAKITKKVHKLPKNAKDILLYRCYYPHLSRDSVSPLCKIFITHKHLFSTLV